MDIIARFTESFLTREESVPFSEQELEWVCYRNDTPGHRQRGRWRQLLAQVHQSRAESSPVATLMVLIPTEYTHIQRITLPKASRRQMTQAIPYLLEESLANDVGDEHIVWSITADRQHACCIAIQHSIMQALHGLLQGSGLPKLILLPDALPLLQSGCHGLTFPSPDRALVVNAQGAVCLAAQQLLALSLDAIPDTVRICGSDDPMAEYSPGEWPGHAQVSRNLDFFALLRASHPRTLENLNLLCGPYTQVNDHGSRHRAMRYAALALLSTWSLHILSDAILARYHAGKAQIEQEQAQALYAEYFPSGMSYPDNLKRHLDLIARDLRERRQASLFLPRHTLLVDALSSAKMLDAVKPIDIHYSARTETLNVTLSIPSVAFSEQVIAAVEQAGGRIRLIAANNAEEGATIRVALFSQSARGATD